MSQDINNVVLIGRLVRDAELRYTNIGAPVTRFSIIEYGAMQRELFEEM